MIPYPHRVPHAASIAVNRVSASSLASWFAGEHGDSSSEGTRLGRHPIVALGLAYIPASEVMPSDAAQPSPAT